MAGKPKNNIVAAIELGSTKIVTLIAQVSTSDAAGESSISIVGVSSVEARGIKKDQVVDLEEVVESTITCVEAAERMAGYNLDSAYVSIGGGHIESQNSHGVVAVSDPGGEINDDDVDRVLEGASAVSLPSSREVIHVVQQEYIVDGEEDVKDPVGMSGTRLEVNTHIVTGSVSAAKNVRKAVGEVGVNVNELVFSGLAAAEAVLSPTEKELGCIVVDIGGGTTSIAAFIEGALSYSGVIPIGAKNITNDLAIGLRVPLDSAEKVKRALSKKKKEQEDKQLNLKDLGVEESKKVSVKTLTEGIIRPRLNEIFTMVRLELEKNSLNHRVPSGVIVTGGGAETVGVIDSARRTLSLPARIGEPKGLKGLVDDIISPAFATSAGLIIYGSVREPEEGLSSIAKRFKFHPKGMAGKLMSTIRDLLP